MEAVDAGLNLMICDHGEMEEPPFARFAEDFKNRTDLRVHFLPRKSLIDFETQWCMLKNV